jgi:L-threonylcarbamoyladenylate synthase
MENDQQIIHEAAKLLRAGELVGFPTETVYGLGADARNEIALAKVFAAKGRPADHPLIVHIGSIAQLSDWAREIPACALQLAKAFWPGPLTLILKKADGVNDLITGGQDTVGIRIPKHTVAQQLLNEFGGGIAGPSANRFGRISPTTAAAVVEELGASVSLVLDGGQCDVGVESTIVDVSSAEPVVLRPGMISAAAIADVLKQAVGLEKINRPRVSGSHDMHYAPRTPAWLVTSETLVHVAQEAASCAVVCYSDITIPGVQVVRLSTKPEQYAHDLYLVLRELDKQNYSRILIEVVPSGSAWEAVRDRLLRASQGLI